MPAILTNRFDFPEFIRCDSSGCARPPDKMIKLASGAEGIGVPLAFEATLSEPIIPELIRAEWDC